MNCSSKVSTAGIKIHQVKAFNKKWTSKFGLGSIALRSLWFYRKKVNQLLKKGHFDLIYFSTTQFPVCILGASWKKRFQIPYVIDMQDPWFSDYYENKPKEQRPADAVPQEVSFCYEGGVKSFVEYLNENKTALFPKPIYIFSSKRAPTALSNSKWLCNGTMAIKRMSMLTSTTSRRGRAERTSPALTPHSLGFSISTSRTAIC